MATSKKRVLIGLFGLSRTFKTTSDLLFERIIKPNSDFEFDIVINTDFESNTLTANRPDNIGSTSKYKYENEDKLREELTESYNRNGQLKDIIIYNKESNFIVFPWGVVYKRIQQILKNRFENNDKYDIYIMLRLDIIISNVLNLNEINNEFVFISGSFTRTGYLHDRDVDGALYGSYAPFMYWIYSTVNYFESIFNLNMESVRFFDRAQFCDNNIIQLHARNGLNLHTIYSNDEIFKILGLIKLNHANCNIFDHYNFNGSAVPYDFSKYYQIPNDHMIRIFLYNINAILNFASFQLSEHRNGIVYHIIR